MMAARGKVRESTGPPATPRTALPQAEAAPPVSNLALQQALRAGALRAKLAVGSPDDPAEAEADRIAEQVTRGGPCGCGGTCAKCGGGGVVRRQAAGPAGAASARTAAFAGGGRPLSRDLRAYFEPRLGADLGAVRVHDDTHAATTARNIAANAFTAGNDIGFAEGQFAPETPQGRKLLAHELVHVAQQSRGAPEVKVRRQPNPAGPTPGSAPAPVPGSTPQPPDTVPPAADPKTRDLINKAIASGDLADVVAISDITGATFDERIRLIAILNNSGLASEESVLELEIKYWYSFGNAVGPVIMTHEDVWNSSASLVPTLWTIPPIKAQEQQFVTDLEQLATTNLDANRSYIVAREATLGLGGPSPDALSPELLTKLRRNLQEEAYKVHLLRQKQDRLKEIQIGFVGGDIASSKALFDPLRPPESISGFQRTSGLFDRTERPRWQDLKLVWDTAANEIGRVAAVYPEIYAALASDNAQAVLDLSRYAPDAFGGNAKALLDSQIERIESAQRLVNDHKIDMLHLKPLVARVLSEPGAVGRNWTAGFAHKVAQHLVDQNAQGEADLNKLLDAVQIAAMVAQLIPGVGLGARLVAGAVAVGVEAGRGAAEWNEGTNLGKLARATPLSGTELVDQSDADKLRTDGVLKIVDAAVNAALIGGSELAIRIGGTLLAGIKEQAAVLRSENAAKISASPRLQEDFAKLDEILGDPAKAEEAGRKLDTIEADLATKEPTGGATDPSAPSQQLGEEEAQAAADAATRGEGVRFQKTIGGRTLKYTDSGHLVVCSSPCDFLFHRYETVLDAGARARLTDIDTRLQTALNAGDLVGAERVFEEALQIEAELNTRFAGWLSTTEGTRIAGGPEAHLLTEHGPDVTNKHLIDRVNVAGVRSASRFTDARKMEIAIADTIAQYRPQINAWVQTAPAGTNFPGGLRFNPGIGDLGIGYEWNAALGKAVQITDKLETCFVVLKADGQGGFIVQTAFPER